MVHTYTLQLFLTLYFSTFLLFSCTTNQPATPNEIFASDDPRIGEAIDTELRICADSSQNFELLDRATYWKAYNYMDSLMLGLLNTNKFEHASDFNWKIRIFDDQNIKSAFVLPGGYIYFSKDLLLFLENEAELVGILAHEMVATDSRIITDRLTNEFSISYLLDIALGGQIEASKSVLNSVMHGRYTLKNSKAIDDTSRDVICSSFYDIRSYASFISRATSRYQVEWLSMYPYAENWVEIVTNTFDTENCAGEIHNALDYEAIKLTLD